MQKFLVFNANSSCFWNAKFIIFTTLRRGRAQEAHRPSSIRCSAEFIIFNTNSLVFDSIKSFFFFVCKSLLVFTAEFIFFTHVCRRKYVHSAREGRVNARVCCVWGEPQRSADHIWQPGPCLQHERDDAVVCWDRPLPAPPDGLVLSTTVAAATETVGAAYLWSNSLIMIFMI